ncbi:peptide chain release factor N(5)-glutamine methyltransferase [Amnibacterium setariae]|uniref:Release factor glutamine methyltransferase n=1 Tax=Amnibacterium setariae TaxID=2306585 RepID=A0A3A1U2E6_9MICO|nr:peptide chain release factor N(5)-glutamine methyltransferase [Amnibacterium setariae]RIX31105.1 peptide chain release factor N(5)-glutamine methyltransferase [Amnibacterium setariae]
MTGLPPRRADELLRAAVGHLRLADVPDPRIDAELLLAHVLGVNRGRAQALALLGSSLSQPVADRYRALVLRRGLREPLQHLTGVAHFRRIELLVGPGVFVPRPETEVLVEHALRGLPEGGTAVDLGTGSGAIALSIAHERPDATVIALERSPEAFAWAERNRQHVGAANARVLAGDLAVAADLLPELLAGVDVVVSNPPYVPDGMVPRDPEVQRFDPAAALYGGPDGLDPMRAVVATAERLLRPGGLLAVEHGELQGEGTRALLADGWTEAATHPDLTGRDRVTTARRAG